MKTIYLAQMKWCEREEPLCVGTNKKNVRKEAYRMLKAEYGNELVCRGAAMCSLPITHDDIEILEIPIVE